MVVDGLGRLNLDRCWHRKKAREVPLKTKAEERFHTGLGRPAPLEEQVSLSSLWSLMSLNCTWAAGKRPSFCFCCFIVPISILSSVGQLAGLSCCLFQSWDSAVAKALELNRLVSKSLVIPGVWSCVVLLNLSGNRSVNNLPHKVLWD